MAQILDAVFENGVFRPLAVPGMGLSEGQQVRLVVEPVDARADALVLAMQVYDGLSQAEIDDLERIILERRDFFGSRAPS